jgi:hypothetical protein
MMPLLIFFTESGRERDLVFFRLRFSLIRESSPARLEQAGTWALGILRLQ